MTKLFLAAGVAALAIAAPATAKPDGHGGGKGGAAHAKQDRGGGGQKARADRAPKAERRVERRQVERRVERAPKRMEMRAERRAPDRKAERQEIRRIADRRIEVRGRGMKAERKQIERIAKAEDRKWDRRDDRVVRAADRRDYDRDRNYDRDRDVFRDRDIFADRDWRDRALAGNAMGLVGGCPPGLAKKTVACMPPGQAKQLIGRNYDDVRRIADLRDMPSSLRYIYGDNDDYYYRYANGYAYRVDKETQLVNALLPLFGLGVSVGQTFPTAYNSPNYYVPSAYQPFYADTPDYYYRYGDGYVYQVGRDDGLVMDYVPLLANGYGYGQMLPASYSAYNVPYDYRPYYQDTSDYYYRYAPGAIYRVDSGSGLIDQVAALLGSGMTVGQQMPLGYDVYNVPYDYRGQYADTSDNWYRYANGNIYQVDPTTRLVTALVQAVLT